MAPRRSVSPTVSVLIPAFDAEAYLGQAIESVLGNADADPLEIIVVDDGSADNTRGIAKSFGRYVQYFEIEHCGHPGRVRNYGVERALGQYVAFLDADDYCLPGRIRRQAELARLTGAEIVFSDATVLCNDSGTRGSWLEKIGAKSEIERSVRDHVLENPFGLLLKLGSFLIPSLALVDKVRFQEAGGFDEDLRCAEDFDLFVRLAINCRFAYESEPLVVRRVLRNSVSSDRRQRILDGLKVCEKIIRLSEETGQASSRQLLEREQARLYREQAALYLEEKDLTAARASWRKSIGLTPSPRLMLYWWVSFVAGGLLTASQRWKTGFAKRN